jgi:mono/diheme cytochrome c family protein
MPETPLQENLRIIRTCAWASAFAVGIAAAAPPASDCPQPRFTGKAPEEYLARKSPLAPGADISEGERIFRGTSKGISCASCHGVKGDGRGEMAEMFDPRPRNFQCTQTVNGIPDGQLFWVIRYGSPGTSMPGHPNLGDDQVWKVVAHLRKLAR